MYEMSPTLIAKTSKSQLNELAIKITMNQKSGYLRLGSLIEKKYWNYKNEMVEGSHPKSSQINSFIGAKMIEVIDVIFEFDSLNYDYSVLSICRTLKLRKDNKSFFLLSASYLDRKKKEGGYGSYVLAKHCILQFKLFLQNDIEVNEITMSLLKDFIFYLKYFRSFKQQTINNILNTIRDLLNQAIDQGIVNIKNYPFGQYKIKIPACQTVKIGLSQSEIRCLEHLDDTFTSQEQHFVNCWLFSFYLAGMRMSDVLALKWSSIIDGRLFYIMGKTNRSGSLKIPKKALLILDSYRGANDNSTIFGEIKDHQIADPYLLKSALMRAIPKINRTLKRVASKLKIKKKLTTSIARHTFASLSGDMIPVQLLKELYRHSRVETTLYYQKSFINKKLDDALELVIDF